MTPTTRSVPSVVRRSPMRWPAASAALTIAAAHVPVTPEHLSQAPYIGLSFVALEIVAIGLAIALVNYDTTTVWRNAIVVPALAIAAFLVTRSVALPEIADDKGNWAEPLGFVALSAEALLLILAVVERSRVFRAPRRRAVPVVVAGLVLALGLAATAYAAVTGG